MPRVEEFLWDDLNESKVQGHGLSADAVDSILEATSFAIFANKRGMRGAYQLVGRDYTGRFITVIIQPTPGDPHLWRPVTAWPSKKGETTKAQKQGVK